MLYIIFAICIIGGIKLFLEGSILAGIVLIAIGVFGGIGWFASGRGPQPSREEMSRAPRPQGFTPQYQQEAPVARCPRCGCAQLSANKRGYKVGRGFWFGPLFGMIGMNKLQVTCLNCGYTFKPGKS